MTMPATKRLKQCPECRQRVGFRLDTEDGELKIGDHKAPDGKARCPGTGARVKQR